MTHEPSSPPGDVGIVGRGRMGQALARALAAAGVRVHGPWGRDEDASALPDDGVVLLCVPDAEIERAARAVRAGPLLGHCSGAATLAPLGARGGFSLHPLLTVARDGAASFRDAWCAVAGSSPRATSAAFALARCVGMHPVTVAEGDRALYHAAASLAANHLVTVLDAAERMMSAAGVPRAALVPLASAAVRNWGEMGGERALTGPIARRDEETVARQREAVSSRAPELLPLWDALTVETRRLAERAAPRSTDPGIRNE